MKNCTNTKCQQINPQPFANFNSSKSHKDGLRSHCKSCLRAYRKENSGKIAIYQSLYQKTNREDIAIKKAIYYQENKEVFLLEMAEYYKENREYKLSYQAEYRSTHKEEIRETQKFFTAKNKNKKSSYDAIHRPKYAENNKGIIAANLAMYRSTKIKATPKWLSRDQKFEIQAIYIESARLSKETGVPHHVDHIEALRGKNVCGLHVPWNLQILTAKENMSKGNRGS